MQHQKIIDICPICSNPLVYRGGSDRCTSKNWEYYQILSCLPCEKDFWKIWREVQEKVLLIFKKGEPKKITEMMDVTTEKIYPCKHAYTNMK